MDQRRTVSVYPRLQDLTNNNGILTPSFFASQAEFYRSPIDTKQHLTLIMAKHVCYDSMKYGNPSYTQGLAANIRNEQYYVKANNIKYENPMYCITYHPEYGSKSFYQISHFNDHKNKNIAHSLTLNIRLSPKTMRPGMVDDNIKNLCDNTWNDVNYDNNLKLKYKKLKNQLSQNMKYVNDNYKKMQSDTSQMLPLFSFRVQFRLSDQDILRHINHVTDFKLIEECLNHFDNKIAKKHKIIYSTSVVYWKVTRIKKYKYCYIIIRNKNDFIFKDEKMNKNYKATDYYGTVSVCKECCKALKTNENVNICQDEKHVFENQRGFVVRVVDKKVAKL